MSIPTMMDLGRLRANAIAMQLATPSPELVASSAKLMKEAADEIEHLRSLFGAVTSGAGDYRTIAKDVRHDLCGNE